MLERWPLSSRFPVVDLSRLVIGFSPSDVYGVRGKLLEVLFKSADWDESWETGNMSKPRETNVMLALKALANIFRTGAQIQDDQLTWVSPYISLSSLVLMRAFCRSWPGSKSRHISPLGRPNVQRLPLCSSSEWVD